MGTILFLLRGRPGLGHVIPGFAIAQELRSRGESVLVATYQQGAEFLRHCENIPYTTLMVEDTYDDWPGLSLYPHGVREVIPMIRGVQANCLVFGGEYFLTPICTILDIPGVLVMNLNTFNKPTHQSGFSQTLRYLARHCELVCSMLPFEHQRGQEASGLPPILTGPFTPKGQEPLLPGRNAVQDGLVLLLANGGGCDFPRTTRSYSQDQVVPTHWRDTTALMTHHSIAAALRFSGQDDRIFVYSCLDEETNDKLRSAFETQRLVTISRPTLDFYRVLPRADVLVSRAGAGLAADSANTQAQVVVWPLPGHDEQQMVAAQLTKSNPHTLVAPSVRALHECMEAAILAARTRPRPQIPSPNRVATAADLILDIRNRKTLAT